MHGSAKSTYRKKKGSQPIFYYKDNKELEIKAGGVIFYHIDSENHLKFLMIKNRGKYEDFGGKTEKVDTCIEDTISREVDEESNSIFKKSDVKKGLKNNSSIYTNNSKYLLYFYKLDTDDYTSEMFGDIETYENIPRTVEWVSYLQLKDSVFVKKFLNYRLKFRAFFSKVNELQKITPKKEIKQSTSVSVM